MSASYLLLTCVAAVVLSACHEPPTPPPSRPIRIMTGLENGTFAAAGRALADVYEAAIPEAVITVLPSGGAAQTLESLEHGDIEVGFSFANVAYAASVGQLNGQGRPYSRLRGMALLQRSTLHFLAGPQSAVRSVSDLRGKRAGFGYRVRSSTTVDLVLQAFGLDPVPIHARQSIRDDIQELLAGRLDAVFVVGTQPAASVQTAIEGGARLLPLEGPEIDQLLRQEPFLSAIMVPAGTYPGLAHPVVTIALNGVLLCRADVDDDMAYRLTKALYEMRPNEAAAEALGHWVDPSVGAATPIPLHPGAARYYRERELSP